MPRIEALRVFPGLWVAWDQNDYGERHHQSLGITKVQAVERTLRRRRMERAES